MITNADLGIDPGNAINLRRYLSDLVALSTLPAVWVGQLPKLIVEGFADALLRTLRVDLVYVRVDAISPEETTMEAISTALATQPRPSPSDVGCQLGPWLQMADGSVTTEVLSPLADGGRLGLAVAPVGHAGGAFGVVAVGSTRRDFASAYDRLLMRVGANQLAVALQVAQLQAAQSELAALEERQRLARELHDSVSQALYGIGLGIQTALDQLRQDPVGLGEPLRYAQHLTEVSLAEMRALIFALRPESLEKEGLVAALRKSAAALRARHELAVVERLSAEPEISLKAKEALFRIAQEAMHNIAKHAGATAVEVSLEAPADALTLTISDNGIGFDATREFPGHLGLQSMSERARDLGGEVVLSSSPGSGTRITVTLPSKQNAAGSSSPSRFDSQRPR